VSEAVLEIADVSKNYHGLRPLRLQQLIVGAGEQIAILGFDQPSAEVFVNLITGVTLPDVGEIRVFGRPTSAIVDSADWLRTVDRFGIVSARAVLLDQLTVIQNLAMPFTLDIEPPPDDVRRQAEELAAEVGLRPTTWTQPVADLDAAAHMRVRIGRALALRPAVLLLEHVSAGLDSGTMAQVGRDLRTIAGRRGASVIAATADAAFARAVAPRVLTLEPATGRLIDQSRGGWFRRTLG
jgi:ABC-type polar amino acid transport system ATPase subunit